MRFHTRAFLSFDRNSRTAAHGPSLARDQDGPDITDRRRPANAPGTEAGAPRINGGKKVRAVTEVGIATAVRVVHLAHSSRLENLFVIGFHQNVTERSNLGIVEDPDGSLNAIERRKTKRAADAESPVMISIGSSQAYSKPPLESAKATLIDS